MKNTYDLSGLIWVIAGNILQIGLSIIEGIAEMTGRLTDAAGGAMSIAGAAASAIMIIGLFKTARYSPALDTAKAYLLAAVVCSVIGVLLAGFYQQTVHSTTAPAGFIVARVLLTAAAVAALFFVYKLFQGCRELAETQDNSSFAEKCRKGWYLYLILFFAGIAAGVVLLVAAPEADLSALSLVLEFLLTSAAKLAACFIVFQTFRKFHGQEIREKEFVDRSFQDEKALS